MLTWMLEEFCHPINGGTRRHHPLQLARSDGSARYADMKRMHSDISTIDDLVDGHIARVEKKRGSKESADSADGKKPSGARQAEGDLFFRAEALCSEGRFEEAIPLLEAALRQLRLGGWGSDQTSMHNAQADIWAHMGVALQSLDRLHEALASYGRAVALNPDLHACYANLAALHHHLANTDAARHYVDKALAISPENQAYVTMRQQIFESARG